MDKKTVERMNAGIAIYYGITGMLTAFGCLIGIGVWLVKAFTNREEFSWGVLIGLLALTGVLGFIGYSLVRVGMEQTKK